MLIYILALVGGFVLLVKGSDCFVEGASGIARKFGIPQLIIGLTIVAMGTSVPEAAVSITAAFKGSAEITIGNVVGSNILNILIILGIASVIVPIAVKKSTLKYEIPYMLFCTMLLLALGSDGVISFVDGIILWGAFIVYLIYLFINAKRNICQEEGTNEKNWRLILFVAAGIAAVVIGSKITVYGATKMARYFGISERFIGLTIVALGTSLPELFTSVIAAKKGNADIAIGNIVGSNIFNILFIVGTTAFLAKVPFDRKFIVDSVVAILACIILFVCSIRGKKLTRFGGIIILFCYAIYFVYLCLM